jgi:hypothetical protein
VLAPGKVRDEQRQQLAAARLTNQSIPWILLGTLLAFVLGSAGLLPPTGAKIRAPAAPPSGIPAGPEPPRRSAFVRAFFVVLWPVVFFIAAGLTMSALAGSFAAESDEVQRQISQESARQHAGWISLVSLGLFVLGCVGVLPLTGARIRSRATLPPPGPADGRGKTTPPSPAPAAPDRAPPSWAIRRPPGPGHHR